DGTSHSMSIAASPVRDANGLISGAVISIRDVTERTKEEEARARLTAILEATSDFVSTSDSNGNVLYLNAGGRKALEIGEADNLSPTNLRQYHPKWAQELILNEGIPAAIRHGIWSGETAFLSRTGKEIPVSQVILAHKGPSGAVEYLSTIARDVTERKRAEEALRQSEEKLRRFIEYSEDGIVLIDQEGTIVEWNRAQERIVGLKRDEVMGQPIWDIQFGLVPEEKRTPEYYA
ncbi:MAG: PAS domain S-box protein, partial [Chloroflexi bacterium]|nr:PAS domain S-box protein [Chloroflexota bacterium]